MFGMNQGPMTFNQIMDILNQNEMMKIMVFTLIQNPIIMNTMMNIMNTLIYNSFLMEQIKNAMNQQLKMENLIMNINNQNLNMINNMGMMNHINNIEENKIVVAFQKSSTIKKTFVSCYFNEKISNIIKKYKEMSNDYDKEEKFLFNGITLNPSETVYEGGITNGSLIIVLSLDNLKGGGNMPLYFNNIK